MQKVCRCTSTRICIHCAEARFAELAAKCQGPEYEDHPYIIPDDVSANGRHNGGDADEEPEPYRYADGSCNENLKELKRRIFKLGL